MVANPEVLFPADVDRVDASRVVGIPGGEILAVVTLEVGRRVGHREVERDDPGHRSRVGCLLPAGRLRRVGHRHRVAALAGHRHRDDLRLPGDFLRLAGCHHQAAIRADLHHRDGHRLPGDFLRLVGCHHRAAIPVALRHRGVSPATSWVGHPGTDVSRGAFPAGVGSTVDFEGSLPPDCSVGSKGVRVESWADQDSKNRSAGLETVAPFPVASRETTAGRSMAAKVVPLKAVMAVRSMAAKVGPLTEAMGDPSMAMKVDSMESRGRVDGRLDGSDGRVEGDEGRVDGRLEGSEGRVEGRLDGSDGRVEGRLDGIEGRLMLGRLIEGEGRLIEGRFMEGDGRLIPPPRLKPPPPPRLIPPPPPRLIPPPPPRPRAQQSWLSRVSANNRINKQQLMVTPRFMMTLGSRIDSVMGALFVRCFYCR